MKNKKHFLQLNNQGSALVVVLVMVSFVMVLTVISATSALTNYKMKVMNKKNTKNFYTAEEAADELYAVLGKMSSECFDTAFQNEVSKIVTSVNASGQAVILDNTKHNAELRFQYINQVLERFFDASDITKYTDPSTNMKNVYLGGPAEEYCNEFVGKLNSDDFLGYQTGGNLSIVKVTGVRVDRTPSTVNTLLSNFKMEFTDCVIQYKDSDGYFSYITLNGEISMPDTLVNFVADETKGLNSFTKYSLIGNTGVTIADTNATISGSIYAGGSTLSDVNAGLNIQNASTSTAIKRTHILSEYIVAPDSVTIGNYRVLRCSGSSLWSTNINVNGNRAQFISNNFCTINVYDDLNVNGNEADVTLGGTYNGFGYSETEKAVSPHANNSSILMNGYNSHITFINDSKIIVAGHSYIDFTKKILFALRMENATKNLYTSVGDTTIDRYIDFSNPFFRMNDGLSYTGLQELYAVPTIMYKDDKLSNDYLKNSAFFAGDLLVQGKDQNKYKTIQIDGKVYNYLNFSSYANMEAYVERVVDDEVFESFLSSKNDATKTLFREQRKYVKDLIQVNLRTLNSTVEDQGAEFYSDGTMVLAEQSGDSISLSVKGKDTFSYTGGYKKFSADIYERFNNLCHTLLEDYEIGSLSSNIFDNFVDRTNFQDAIKDGAFKREQNGCILLATDADVVIGSNPEGKTDAIYVDSFDKGVILTTGKVRVEKDFSGMIMSDDKITISSDADVTIGNEIKVGSDIITVEKLITGDREFAQIFKPFKDQAVIENGDAPSISIEDLSFADLVKFSKWRKSEN